MLPDTYLIPGDPPVPPALGAYTLASAGSTVDIPPAASQTGTLAAAAACMVAFDIGTTGAVGSDAFVQFSPTGAPTDFFTMVAAASYAAGQQTINVNYWQIGAGTGKVTLAAGTAAHVVFGWVPYAVAGAVVTYLGSVTVNGSLIFSGQFQAKNTGALGPVAWFGHSDGGGIVPARVALQALPSSLVLNKPSGARPGTPITLTGTNAAPVLATGLDYSLDGGATFQRVSTFTGGATWTATIPAMAKGPHPVIVRDHNAPLLQSASVTVDVLPPAKLQVHHVSQQVFLSITAANLRESQVVEQVWLQAVANPRIGLYQSDVLPSSTDTYVEFGSPLAWNYATALLPDNQQQRNNSMVITTLDLAFIGNSPVVNVDFTDSQGNLLASSQITPTGSVSQWNGTAANSTWNEVPWNGTVLPLSPWQIPWSGPIVFKQGQFSASGASQPGFKISSVYLEYQVLGYVAQYLSGSS